MSTRFSSGIMCRYLLQAVVATVYSGDKISCQKADMLIEKALDTAEALHQQLFASLPLDQRAWPVFARLFPRLKTLVDVKVGAHDTSEGADVGKEMTRAIAYLRLYFDEECAYRAQQVRYLFLALFSYVVIITLTRLYSPEYQQCPVEKVISGSIGPSLKGLECEGCFVVFLADKYGRNILRVFVESTDPSLFEDGLWQDSRGHFSVLQLSGASNACMLAAHDHLDMA